MPRGSRPEPTPAERRATKAWDASRAQARRLARTVSPEAGDAVWREIAVGLERALTVVEDRLTRAPGSR